MKKRVAAVYGAGNKSLEAEKIISKYLNDVGVYYAIENKEFNKIGTMMKCLGEGDALLEVISLNTLAEKYKKDEINMVIYPTSYHIFDLNDIINNCKKVGIREEDIFAVPINILRKETIEENEFPQILTHYYELEQFCHLDIHILDFCNINCKACAHFSTLASKTEMLSCAELERNLTKLKTIIPGIRDITILGGEPLLHPDLKELIKITRIAYPHAEISICTNGVKLCDMEDDLIIAIKENDIIVIVSMYPPFKGKLETWLTFFEKKQLKYHIQECELFERRLIPYPAFNGKEVTKRCGHDFCMRGKYIGRCPIGMFTDYFNNVYGDILPVTSGVDIFEMKTGLELIEALESPLELCDYCCARDHYYEEWDCILKKKMQPEDWFIKLPEVNKS